MEMNGKLQAQAAEVDKSLSILQRNVLPFWRQKHERGVEYCSSTLEVEAPCSSETLVLYGILSQKMVSIFSTLSDSERRSCRSH
jgi:hypothetical protein